MLSTNSYYGNPASVSISGSKITVTLPTRLSNADRSVTGIATGHDYTITFTDGAGLRNPNSAGRKTITVQDIDDENHEYIVEIESHISIPPASSWVSRGDEVEVTAKGINATGDATVHLHTAHRLMPSPTWRLI